MIKKTFYNLPDEKRNRIIDAIVNEFSSATTEKVSINRIIKAANISRGSFYQYFDDKVDLVEVMMKTFVDAALTEYRIAISKSNGDIFYTYIRLFKGIIKLTENEKQKQIMKNLFKNLKANDDLVSDYMVNRFECFTDIKNICEKVNRSNLKFKSDDDVSCLSQILMQLLKNALFNVFTKNSDIQKIEKDFVRKIEIIKCGAVIKTTSEIYI